MKFLCSAAMAAGVLIAGFSSQAAQQQVSCCPNGSVVKKPATRGSKLVKKHSNELRALKEIHKIQSSFLEKFDGKTSRVSQQERSNLQILLEHLPSAAKSSDMPYADKMLYIEYTVYDILNGKEKYSRKKAMKSPEKLLKDIQSKQLRYLRSRQQRESKKYKK